MSSSRHTQVGHVRTSRSERISSRQKFPGLQLALARPPVTITLELRRLNGTTLHCELPFPDEISALALKSLATTVRSKPT